MEPEALRKAILDLARLDAERHPDIGYEICHHWLHATNRGVY